MARPTAPRERFVYDHPHPAVTVDCVVFGLSDGGLRLLLIRRGEAPFAGSWALPGGFVRMDETTDEAVLRELEEETGASRVYVEQLYTFSAVDRDPRERVISVGYYALVRPDVLDPVAGSDAADARWFPTTHLPELAFDHGTIVRTALERLRSKVRVQPLGFELLPKKFTLRQLQQLYEAVLGRELDKRNFRSKLQGMGILDALDERAKSEGVTGRAPQLFRFNRRAYERLVKTGFHFEL